MAGNDGKDPQEPKVEQIQAVAQIEVILTAGGKLIMNCLGDAPFLLAALAMAQHAVMEKIAPQVEPRSNITVPHMGGIRL